MKQKKNLHRLVIYLDYILLAVLVSVMSINYYNYIKNTDKMHNINHYNGIPISQKQVK